MYILEGSRYEFEEVLAKSGLNIEEETWMTWINLDRWIPSGGLSHGCGKSQFLMGKSTISMAIFNSFLYVYQMASSFICSTIF